MRKRLVKLSFTVLLFVGVLGLYLAFYGPFKISLTGFVIASMITAIIVYFDVTLRGNTYNIHDQLSAPNLIICTILYFTLSGWVLVRAGHELISERQINTGLFSTSVRGGYKAKLCRQGITIREPVEFSGLQLCLSHQVFSNAIHDAEVDRLTRLRRIVFGFDVSLLGEKIFLPTNGKKGTEKEIYF
ncbi:hypothetical protein [Ectopseudomonas khazarica]|uniref:hypothetical protein n=1 Tax=Ectopseudomonas khazarica TaxID=2502979 RepID=UPI0037CC1ADD